MTKHFLLTLLCALAIFLPGASAAGEILIPRTIIALYDSKQEDKTRWTLIHTFAEMPLNHLGLVVEYHDIHDPLPDLAKRSDVRGILSWLPGGSALPDPEKFLRWAIDAVDGGKKFVIFGGGFGLAQIKESQNPVAVLLANHFFQRIGLHFSEGWVSITYDVEFLHKNPEMVEFERKYGGILPPFSRVEVTDDAMVSHLVVQKKGRPETKSHLVVTGPKGGYVAEDYECYFSLKGERPHRQWYVNPFLFFRVAFGTDDLPKPDTATIAGRRIYYSHIDGDGWTSLTQIEQYRRHPVLASQVVMDHAIKPFEDLPVTAAPIAAELDPDWVGTEESRRVAKEFLALPQVEIGSHTLSHPFDWEFFADGNPDKERPLLRRYQFGSWEKGSRQKWFPTDRDKKAEEAALALVSDPHDIPRAYANEPFNLEDEIRGAVDIIEELAPKGKKVKIVMWSGDTSPFEAALRETREAGLLNINGGDSRFDREYDSYAWVSPVGRPPLGKERQIYSSNSNENTYTELWSGRFFGFKFLKATLECTENPLRVKPFNVYYHMYSGEKQASLHALVSNLEYARTQELAPITASNYAAIGNGFYSAEIVRKDAGVWLIRNRGGLQTIRFDNKPGRAVDFSRSRGVIGQRHYQDNLYVYLDEGVEYPIIALKPHEKAHNPPRAGSSYLVHSRWKVRNLKRSGAGFRFTAEGFGNGEMHWYVPAGGSYTVKAGEGEATQMRAKDNVLTLSFGNIAMRPIEIRVTKAD